MSTRLEIKTEFFPLAWFLFFVTPTIEINGEKHKKKWGTTSFDLSPGEYKVKIYFPYIGRAECGANNISVSLSEGDQKRISYYMPPWMFSKGSIKLN